MDLSTLANLINAFAVTAGVIFAAAQIRYYRRQRKRDAMLNLARSFQSPTFARGFEDWSSYRIVQARKKFARFSDRRAKI